MAFSGVFITFGEWMNSGIPGSAAGFLPVNAIASQYMTESAVSEPNPNSTVTLLSISASTDIIYITGKNLTLGMLTDGVTPKRYYNPWNNNGEGKLFVNAGDQVAWMWA
jgi:hypothetical protein